MSSISGTAQTTIAPPLTIEQKLLQGDVLYSHSFWGDFRFYIRNNHILISIFAAHPRNPFSRVSRFIVFLASNLFAVFLASIAQTTGFKAQLILNYCVFVLLQTFYDNNAQSVATCACLRRERCPSCVRHFLAPVLGSLSASGFFCFSLVLFLIMVIFYAASDLNFRVVMRQYAIAKVVSLVVGIFPMGIIQYSFLRNREAKGFLAEKDKTDAGRIAAAGDMVLNILPM
jgi:hypothetical protein